MIRLCTVDEDDIESMVNEALSVATVDITEKYVHTSCVHAATIFPSDKGMTLGDRQQVSQ